MNVPAPQLHLALGLLSAGVVALQLVLMQLLAITQWHHFAYLVISVALLGFGAAGTLIALCRAWLLARIATLLPLSCLASAVATIVAAGSSLSAAVGFDSFLIFTDPMQFWRLLAVSLILALPFFLAAVALGLVFTAQVEDIGSLYFANMLGSALGGAVALALFAAAPPPRLPAVTALFAVASGLLLLSKSFRGGRFAALAAVAVVAAGLLHPPTLVLSPYKDLRRALEMPGSRLIAESHSPLGLVQAVAGPALRWAPGLGLAYSGEVPTQPALFVNGNAFGPVVPWPPARAGGLLDHTTGALPYVLAAPDKVLVLHSGTGSEVAHALSRNAGRVVAVEPDWAALRLLAERFPDSGGALLRHPAVTVVPVEPRTYLAADPDRYDLIILPTLGTFGGTAGLLALQEQYIFTREAFSTMLRHLNPGGLLCITVWMDYPPRAPLRLTATLAEALAAEGISEPQAHLAAVRGWGTLTFCVSRSPLTAGQVAAVQSFCDRELFDPALLPGLPPAERQHHNRLQDAQFFTHLDDLLGPQRQLLYADYDFRLRPADDDRPFFSQFLRWHSIPRLAALFGEGALPFLEMGYLIVILAFLQMAVASLALILLPLTRLGWRGGRRRSICLYFGGLAVGYMLVEICLIHRFVLYLGHPVHAAAVVVAALLAFSGAGSWCSARLEPVEATRRQAAALVALLLVLYAAALPPLLRWTIALPLAWKVVLALLLLAPPAFAMGFPFPLGLRQLGRTSQEEVPWAWGINGCFSVLSTALATIIAVEAGFVVVQWVAAAAYTVAAGTRMRT